MTGSVTIEEQLLGELSNGDPVAGLAFELGDGMFLESDIHQFILRQKYEAKNGTEMTRIIGCWPYLSMAIDAALRVGFSRRIVEDKNKDISTAVAKMEDMQRDVLERLSMEGITVKDKK